MKVVNLAAALRKIPGTWEPRVVGEVNGHQVKVARLHGKFVWHSHETEDEGFLVLAGNLVIRLRKGTLRLGPGDFVVIPRGVEHRPEAAEEVHCLLFEPAGTVNTGTAGGPRTVEARPL
jgi:mannose-6-phosphate isomerase-like protein (cupin superfamily)